MTLTREVYNQLQSRLGDAITLGKVIGKGRSGVVLGVVLRKTGDKAVVKLLTRGPREEWRDFKYGVREEVIMQRTFAEHDVAPPVLAKPFFWGRNYGAFLMEQVDGTLDDLLLTKLRLQPQSVEWIVDRVADLIRRLCDAKLHHGDLHTGNVAYIGSPDTGTAQFLLLDFATSRQGGPSLARLEWLQFLRGLAPHFMPDIVPGELAPLRASVTRRCIAAGQRLPSGHARSLLELKPLTSAEEDWFDRELDLHDR